MPADKLYTSKLLRTEESALHVKARARLGKQNKMLVAPEALYSLTTDLDKTRIKLEESNAALSAEIHNHNETLQQLAALLLACDSIITGGVDNLPQGLAQLRVSMQTAWQHAQRMTEK